MSEDHSGRVRSQCRTEAPRRKSPLVHPPATLLRLPGRSSPRLARLRSPLRLNLGGPSRNAGVTLHALVHEPGVFCEKAGAVGVGVFAIAALILDAGLDFQHPSDAGVADSVGHFLPRTTEEVTGTLAARVNNAA